MGLMTRSDEWNDDQSSYFPRLLDYDGLTISATPFDVLEDQLFTERNHLSS
jgi:hypothetical protein